MSGFLPISKQDMKDRGIEQLDFICITGDAYVDHPSFGMAIISRVIESEGFTVGVIAQPNYHNLQDFQKLGKPKYAFLVNSGNVDSMVTHYTVAKRRRHDDAYSPGGKGGYRPDQLFLNTGVSEEFRYFGLLSSKTLPPNPITFPRKSMMGKITRFRNLK